MTTQRLVLVVCTGNICRSPMGEAFLREHLAQRGVHNVALRSAGTHAQTGSAAMPEARQAVAAIRGSAESHVASPLDLELARRADLILCAAEEHRRHIRDRWPAVDARKLRLFNEAIAGRAPVDVDDPMGWDGELFGLAARVIDRAMEVWADRIQTLWPETSA